MAILLFILMAFWLGSNVLLATAVWSNYCRQYYQEQADAEPKGQMSIGVPIR